MSKSNTKIINMFPRLKKENAIKYVSSLNIDVKLKDIYEVIYVNDIKYYKDYRNILYDKNNNIVGYGKTIYEKLTK